jgi:hypothetical protein
LFRHPPHIIGEAVGFYQSKLETQSVTKMAAHDKSHRKTHSQGTLSGCSRMLPLQRHPAKNSRVAQRPVPQYTLHRCGVRHRHACAIFNKELLQAVEGKKKGPEDSIGNRSGRKLS